MGSLPDRQARFRHLYREGGARHFNSSSQSDNRVGLTTHTAVVVLRPEAFEERHRLRERLNALYGPVRHVGRRLAAAGDRGRIRTHTR